MFINYTYIIDSRIQNLILRFFFINIRYPTISVTMKGWWGYINPHKMGQIILAPFIETFLATRV